jgi:hypothetical protein
MNVKLTQADYRRMLTMRALAQAERKLKEAIKIGTEVYSKCDVAGFTKMLELVVAQRNKMKADQSLETVPIRALCRSPYSANVLAKASILDVVDILDFTSIDVRKILARNGQRATRFGIISLIPDPRPGNTKQNEGD